MAKYKYISFGNCCILIVEEYGKIEGREISDKHGVCIDNKSSHTCTTGFAIN